MCGIVGFLGQGSIEDLNYMTGLLSHRGPDGEGIFFDESRRVFLGHRRLAVIDLAEGRQPMWDRERNIAVVFNGEIYNHIELRRELEAKGFIFATGHSDTEVLVHGWRAWGRDLPSRLNGMFAFCIWDVQGGVFFLARDRFGEKPLYYSSRDHGFVFASELSALARHPGVSGDLDPRSLQKFFAYGYLPAPNALLRGCRKLPGGAWLEVSAADYRVTEGRYWRYRTEPSAQTRSEEDLADELRHLLAQSIRRRLISDVPLGVFLSGGLDSGATLGLATAAHGRPLPAFTIGFDEPSFDEREPAGLAARHFGADHHVHALRNEDLAGLTENVLASLDEPLGDPSILPTAALCAFARQTVTVALTGDGGDELFAGYSPFEALSPARAYSRLVPRPLHHLLRRLVDRLPVSDRNFGLDFKLRRMLTGLGYPPAAWIPAWMSPIEPAAMAAYFETPLPVDDLYSEAIGLWSEDPAKCFGDRMQDFFTVIYLQDDILTKADRASMRVSLETRAIFLDNDLVEFARRLPFHLKFRDGRGKYLLRKALEPLLPEALLKRPKKGFGIPTSKLLRAMPFPEAVIPGMRTPAMAEAWTRHGARAADHRLMLWNWLAAAIWARKNLHRPGERPRAEAFAVAGGGSAP